MDASGNSRVFNVDDGDADTFLEVAVKGLTITGGKTKGDGGGIFNRENLTVTNSTISGNTAYGDGGGILNDGNITVTSSTIAANIDNEDIEGDDFDSGGNNLIGNGDGATGFSDGVNGDIVGTTSNPIDPLLGDLQDNGGPTQTQALLPGSPAINAGSNPENLRFDQRGPGFNWVIGAQTDIGAYEAVPEPDSTLGLLLGLPILGVVLFRKHKLKQKIKVMKY